eukprot:jgi/Mesvir1/29074/Mv18380-RA.1
MFLLAPTPSALSPLLGRASVLTVRRHVVPRRSFSTVTRANMEEKSANKTFGGWTKRYEHASKSLGCNMKFHVYLPPQAETTKVPVIYWLSGLTCDDTNFIFKAGAQRAAAQHGVALIAPDTSPRGLQVEGESESWDFGVGAGFYVNATVPKWKAWRMYEYVVEELPSLLAAHLPQVDTGNASIMGHSMGGHGALVCALKNPGKYKSVSAFAPICNPVDCPWGIKAFTGYLGDDKKAWEEYDASILASKYTGPPLPILIDQGDKDQFYPHQLKTEVFKERSIIPAEIRMQPGYDHSYYFMLSFMDDHIAHHAKALKN